MEEGTSEHLQRLGIKKLRDEWKFKKLLAAAGAQTIPTATSQLSLTSRVDRKLSILEIKQLPPEEKHIYLMK